MTELAKIPVEEFAKVWPLVSKWFLMAAERSKGKMTAHSMVKAVLDGEWQLWVIWNKEKKEVQAIITTELYMSLSDELKICALRVVVGSHREEWLHHLPLIEGWAESQECSLMQTWARPGWAGILKEDGYRKTHILLEKELSHGRQATRENGHGDDRSNDQPPTAAGDRIPVGADLRNDRQTGAGVGV